MSELMTKHEMTEEDIKLQYITPAIESAGWDKLKQIKMEYNFTDGRVIVRGNVTARGKRKRTDYLLYYKPNIPLAIVEAKDNRHSVGAGMQQAIEYAEVLDIPFVYSSNGDGFLEHDMKSGKERELMLEQFPSPHDLWQRHIGDEHFTPEQEQLITEPYYSSWVIRPLATISASPSTAPLMRLPVGKTAFSSLWRPALARLILRSRLFIAFGNPAERKRSCSLLTATFLSTRPCNRTSSLLQRS